MALICFDLDGTLVDPLEGVHFCVNATCEELGLPCPGRVEVASHIGFGMRGLFRGLPGLSDPVKLEAAMDCYWHHFGEEGVFRHRVFPGAHLLLARLKRQGHRLYVITAKPATFARQVMHHFDLNLIFDDVIGPLPQEHWRSKSEVMKELSQAGVLGKGGYMIGDRNDDIKGAKAHGLTAIGVTYGYGSRRELEEAGADVVVDSLQALDAWLQKELKDPEIHDAFTRSE